MAAAVVFAYHDVGVRCLKVLLDGGVKIPLVVSHRDDPAERIWFDSVAKTAGEYGIPVLMPERPDAPEVIEAMRAEAPDLVFSFYYRHVLPVELLRMAPLGAWNMHGSLLPRHRGRAPVNWAVLGGDAETGATLHEMVARPDAGPIADQTAVPILADDTAHDVMHKVAVAAELTLHRALPALLAGTMKTRPNDLSAGSCHGARRPEDGHIDWTLPAIHVYALIRAVAPPYPGAFHDIQPGPATGDAIGQDPGFETSSVKTSSVKTSSVEASTVETSTVQASTNDGGRLRLVVAAAKPWSSAVPAWAMAPGLHARDGLILATCGDGRALRVTQLLAADGGFRLRALRPDELSLIVRA